MIKEGFEVVLAIPWVVVGLLIAASVFVSFRAYRGTIPPVSVSRRRLLASLRACSFSLMVFLLSAPLLVKTEKNQIRPLLPVLIDRSLSMNIQDALGNRSETVRQLLHDRLPPEWTDSLETVLLSFAEGVEPVAHPDSVRFDGSTTDISAALDYVKSKFSGQDISGVLLISDGQFNLGRHPSSVARSIGFPIFAVGVGDPREPKDVWIDHLAVNDMVYAGTVASIQAHVGGIGFDGVQAEVQLLQAGKVVNRKLIEIGEKGSLTRVDFEAQPSAAGVFRYSVRVVPLAGEFSSGNNERSFALKVLKSRTKVLLVSGAPGPDHAMLYKLLSENPAVTVTARVQRKDGSFHRMEPVGAEQDDAFDVVLFCRFPTAFTNQTDLSELAGLLRGNKLPAAFFLGPDVDFSKLNMLDVELPVSIEADGRLDEEAVPLVTTIAGRNSALLMIGDDFTETERQWNEVPPVWVSGFVVRPEDHGEVLCRADLARASNVWRLKKDVPLVVAGRHPERKTLVVAAHGLWRTHFVMQGLNRNNDAFRTFIQNSIRWLALSEDLKPFSVQTGKPIYRQHERMTLTAQFYDENLRAINDGVVKVDILAGSTRQSAELRALGNGRYETQVILRDTGTVSIVAEASRGGVSMGTERAAVFVEPFSPEFAKANLDEEVLKTVAGESGGIYVRVSSFEELTDKVPHVSKVTAKTSEQSLWSHPVLLFLLVTCLAVEWFIRKRSDML